MECTLLERKMESVSRQTAPVLEKTYQFVLWVVMAVEKMLRAHKFTLGDRIQNTALDALENLIEATYSKPAEPFCGR
jgi:hypothetical protein